MAAVSVQIKLLTKWQKKNQIYIYRSFC